MVFSVHYYFTFDITRKQQTKNENHEGLMQNVKNKKVF